MRIHIVGLVKDAKKITTVGMRVEEDLVRLNPGTDLLADYVQDVGNGAINIHLKDNSVLYNIPKNCTKFDKKKNNEHVQDIQGFSEKEKDRRINPFVNRGCRNC